MFSYKVAPGTPSSLNQAISELDQAISRKCSSKFSPWMDKECVNKMKRVEELLQKESLTSQDRNKLYTCLQDKCSKLQLAPQWFSAIRTACSSVLHMEKKPSWELGESLRRKILERPEMVKAALQIWIKQNNFPDSVAKQLIDSLKKAEGKQSISIDLQGLDSLPNFFYASVFSNVNQISISNGSLSSLPSSLQSLESIKELEFEHVTFQGKKPFWQNLPPKIEKITLKQSKLQMSQGAYSTWPDSITRKDGIELIVFRYNDKIEYSLSVLRK